MSVYIPVQMDPKTDNESKIKLNFDLISLTVKDLQAQLTSVNAGVSAAGSILNAVLVHPATTARNTVVPVSDVVNLTLKSIAGQTANHLEGLNSSGVSQWAFSPAGAITARSLTASTQITAPFLTGTSVGAGSLAAYLAASTKPGYAWQETDQAANGKMWSVIADGGVLTFQTINDANNAAANWLLVTRSLNTITDVSLGNTTNNPTFNWLGTGAAAFGGALNVTGVGTFTAAPVFSSGTASQTMELDGSKALTTVAISGTGNYIKSAAPTFTGLITASKGVFTSDFTLGASTLVAGAPFALASGTGAMTLAPVTFELQTSATLRAANASSEYDLVFKSSRGSIASPTDVANTDATFTISASVYSGGSYFGTAAIEAVVDGTFTTGQRPPSRFEFYTNAANGSQTLALTIDKSQVSTFSGNVKLGTAGNGFYVKEGSNATMGTATLVLGTATVSTTKVTASSRIFLTSEALGTITSPVAIAVTGRSAGTSFTITSANLTDTSTVAWVILEPA